MKKYKINVNHTEYGFVEVEAESEQEASDMLDDVFDSISWGNDETEIESIEEV